MTSKLIFCAHGVSSRDREIEVPFEFSSMQFYCDLGFKLMHPVSRLGDLLDPRFLTDAICKNKVIPRRIKDGEYVEILDMEREINKLKYLPKSNGKIKLNDMLFIVSVTDRQEIIFRENFGLYYCKPSGEIIKLYDIDFLYGLLEKKARELRKRVEMTSLNYLDVFVLLRDSIARLGINPSRTEICMFTCRVFETGPRPGQTPISFLETRGRRVGGNINNKLNLLSYDNMLFLENGVSMVSEEIFNEYNSDEKYNPKFIPIADEVAKLITTFSESSLFHSESNLSNPKSFYEENKKYSELESQIINPNPVNIYGGKNNKNKKFIRKVSTFKRFITKRKREGRKIKKIRKLKSSRKTKKVRRIKG